MISDAQFDSDMLGRPARNGPSVPDPGSVLEPGASLAAPSQFTEQPSQNMDTMGFDANKAHMTEPSNRNHR